MIDQERPGARAGERAGAGNLRRAPRGLDPADQGADRRAGRPPALPGPPGTPRISSRTRAGSSASSSRSSSARKPRVAASMRSRSRSWRPGIPVAAVAHGGHHGAGGLGRHAGVVDAEAGEQRGARGDPLGQRARRPAACAPRAGRRGARSRRRSPRGGRAGAARPRGRSARSASGSRSLAPRRADRRRPPPWRSPPSCRSRSRPAAPIRSAGGAPVSASRSAVSPSAAAASPRATLTRWTGSSPRTARKRSGPGSRA